MQQTVPFRPGAAHTECPALNVERAQSEVLRVKKLVVIVWEVGVVA
jgi:hypothetical protein